MRATVFVGLLTIAGGAFGVLANSGLSDSLPGSADEAYGRLAAAAASPFGGRMDHHEAAQRVGLREGSFNCDMNFTPPPQSSADANVQVNCRTEAAPRAATRR